MDQQGIPDRRKYKRRGLAYYMLVIDARTQETFGHLMDITPAGFLMDCTRSFPLEEDHYLRLDTMPDIATKGYVTFKARTKWCMKDPIEPSLYDVGFRITEIDPSDAQIIQRIAEKYAEKDGFSFRPR